LREICERHQQYETPIDTGSLGRMIVHIGNINRSVSASSHDHANAAKRLKDFATTLGRIGKRQPPPCEDLATRISDLVETLTAAGTELASSAETPKWAQAPAA
jgi:hypothetical protein